MSNLSTSSNPAEDRNFDAELEYTFSFFPFLKPESLMLTCLLQGIRPPLDLAAQDNSPRGLTYCELGCGQGVTLNIVAAGDESGRYFGIDYNPSQIKNARLLADNAGLKNVEFIEESFANLQQRDLPDFDFIVLHGIYSWISEKLRQDIVEFLDRKLKPGGICLISYNCTVGRGSDFAFRQLLQAGLRREASPSPEGIGKSLALAEEFAAKGARYFTSNAGAAERLKDARTRSPTYVFHEYFNPNWTPFFFHEVAQEMAKAQLSFVGTTSIAWNNPDLSIPSTLRSLFESFPSPAEQELLKGIWANQPFRRDIFIKGTPERLSIDEQAATLKGLYFGLTRARGDCPLKVNVPAGVATLPDKPFIPLLDALQNSPVSGEELRRLLPPDDLGDRDFVRALIILFGAEYVELKTPPGELPAIERRFRQLNAAIARCVDKSLDIFMAVTPKNRLAFKMNTINYFLYRAHQTGPEDRVSKAFRLLKSSGRSVIYKNQKVTDRKMAEAVIAQYESKFASTVLAKL